MSKKLFISFILFFSLINTNVFSQEKVAFIDLNYIYSNSKTGKKIIKEIDNKQAKINKDFEEYQKKLDKEKNDLLSKKMFWKKTSLKKELLN